jgi:hypothetical protein
MLPLVMPPPSTNLHLYLLLCECLSSSCPYFELSILIALKIMFNKIAIPSNPLSWKKEEECQRTKARQKRKEFDLN